MSVRQKVSKEHVPTPVDFRIRIINKSNHHFWQSGAAGRLVRRQAVAILHPKGRCSASDFFWLGFPAKSERQPMLACDGAVGVSETAIGTGGGAGTAPDPLDHPDS